jgi:hypothetical protein
MDRPEHNEPTTELSAPGPETPTAALPGRPWFEPASAPTDPNPVASPYQRDYVPQPNVPQTGVPQPNVLQSGAPQTGIPGSDVARIQTAPQPRHDNPYHPGAGSAGSLATQFPERSITDDDDDEDLDDERLSWRRPLITAGIIGVILGLVTTVGIIVTGGTGSDNKADPEPTASASIVGEGRPTNVRLADSGSSVTLQWKDNSGAGAGAIILVRQATDAAFKAAGNPAKGQTSYTISSIQGTSLDPDVDYCFTIASVISNERVAPAEPVCTERGGAQTN